MDDGVENYQDTRDLEGSKEHWNGLVSGRMLSRDIP